MPNDNVGEAEQAIECVPKQTRARRGRPKKEEAIGSLPGQEVFPFVEDAPAAAQSVEEPAVEDAPKELTLDDAKAAGRKLLVAKGADALRCLLTVYGVRKVGDLTADKWKRFIADCDPVKGA